MLDPYPNGQIKTIDDTPHFLNRVGSLPMVNETLILSSAFYAQLKNRNAILGSTLTFAERSASFAYSQIQPFSQSTAINLLDKFACLGLDKLESHAPIFSKTPMEIRGDIKELGQRFLDLAHININLGEQIQLLHTILKSITEDEGPLLPRLKESVIRMTLIYALEIFTQFNLAFEAAQTQLENVRSQAKGVLGAIESSPRALEVQVLALYQQLSETMWKNLTMLQQMINPSQALNLLLSQMRVLADRLEAMESLHEITDQLRSNLIQNLDLLHSLLVQLSSQQGQDA